MIWVRNPEYSQREKNLGGNQDPGVRTHSSAGGGKCQREKKNCQLHLEKGILRIQLRTKSPEFVTSYSRGKERPKEKKVLPRWKRVTRVVREMKL